MMTKSECVTDFFKYKLQGYHQWRKERDIKAEITIQDNPSGKRKDRVHIEEVAHNELDDILFVSDQVSLKIFIPIAIILSILLAVFQGYNC